MPQPVKLSDSLVLDARVAGDIVHRSIAGQVEFWARLGRSIEPLLQGDKVLQLCRSGAAQSLSECLETVDSPEGRARVTAYLDQQPFPHYQPHPTRPGLLERIERDGTRILGRFVNRQFQPIKQARRKVLAASTTRKTKTAAR
jgi:hypothetical protein